jgi:ribosomal protein S12 methylthiotransferase accessory factor
MLTRPQFKPHLHAEVIPPETVYLLSEKDLFALSGRLYNVLAPLLDGRHTVDELVELLEGQATAAEVYFALMHLEGKGYLTEDVDGVAPQEAAFWSSVGVEPRQVRNRLSESRVMVRALGIMQAERLTAALLELGIATGEEADLEVVLVDDYLQEGLEAYNQEALGRSRPWMLIKPVGLTFWFGPVFRPGKTGCWECLAQRLRCNRLVESFLMRTKGTSGALPLRRGVLPSTERAALGLAATEIARALVLGEKGPLDGKVVTLHLAGWQAQNHELIRRPQCPRCGDPGLGKNGPEVKLESRPKGFTADGGHRICTPGETTRRLERHVSPITGAVSELRSSFGGTDGPVHVYFAGSNSNRPRANLRALRQAMRQHSAGKGVSDAQARASALCEAIERYAGCAHGKVNVVQARWADLGPAAIHPHALLQFSATQYRERFSRNAQVATFHTLITQPFDETQPIDWTAVWSLTYNAVRYLPSAFCYYDFPLPEEHRFCWADSNGNAAGNNKEEAILQGFLELVERDSVALWWYNRVQRPRLDLDSFGQVYLHELRDFYRRMHRDYWVLDITSDLGIPAFAAVSRRVDQPQEDIVFGFGAHLDPVIGLLRAVTEMNQMLFYVPAGLAEQGKAPDSPSKELYRWLTTVTLANNPYLAPDDKALPRTRADFGKMWSDDLRDDVLTCVDIARRAGLETLVLDQTQPDIELDVVKVVVPGLRHFWARFAPGRLYDVPVQLGWLQSPQREEELNPIPMFW